MAETLEINGIVLSSMPVGEADRRLSILTKELGRISCFARGARKPTSALISATRPFATGKFHIYPGKDSYSLNRVEISEHFESIVSDVAATAYGSYFLELATRFSTEHYDGGEMLYLLYYALKALTNPQIPNRLVRRIFELRVLKNEGVAPEFTERSKLPDGKQMQKSTAYALNYVETTPVGKLFSFNVTEEVLREMEAVLRKLMDRNLDRPTKSQELLEILAEDA